MNAETLVTVVAALIALGALYFNWRSTDAAVRAAGATEEQTDVQRQQTEIQREQTEIQRQLHRDAAQPYVWADVRPDNAQGTLLHLVVGNSGSTVATNVRVEVDPPLPAIDQCTDDVRSAEALLAQGLRSLPPGRTLIWPLGQGFNLVKQEGSQAHTFNVLADGPFGPVPPLTYVVDLAELRGVMDQPSGSLHQLTKAVKELGKNI